MSKFFDSWNRKLSIGSRIRKLRLNKTFLIIFKYPVVQESSDILSLNICLVNLIKWILFQSSLFECRNLRMKIKKELLLRFVHLLTHTNFTPNSFYHQVWAKIKEISFFPLISQQISTHLMTKLNSTVFKKRLSLKDLLCRNYQACKTFHFLKINSKAKSLRKA